MLITLFLLGSIQLFAQNDTTGNPQESIVKSVDLGEIVINASLSDLDVNAFMKKVKQDTTFYKSFLNMKYYAHDIKGAVAVYDNDNGEMGTMKRIARQHDEGGKMWVKILKEETNGKIRKRNGDWRYLTAKMYDEVFFPQTPEPVSNRIDKMDQEIVKGNRFDKYESELKKFMFNPGAAIESVPLIGHKMAIFDPDMIPYYDYHIFAYTYQDSIPCIAFNCKAKPDAGENQTVIKEITSYFNKKTGQVMARDYTLSNHTLLFMFDIKMHVENELLDGVLVPTHITYSGEWNMPFHRKEIISFQLVCDNYSIKSNLPDTLNVPPPK